MITITHSFAEGTLVSGMARGDGSYEILRANGFRWFPSLRTCGIQSSRDRLSQDWKINTAVTALRAAGLDVAEPEIDNDPRPMEQREADRAARMDERADRLEYRAATRLAAADAAGAVADRLAEAMQGEPVKIGHHSQRRHERDLDRVHSLTHKSIDLRREAGHAADLAASAASHMQHRENPHRTARRLETLNADRRKVQRNLEGYTRNFRNGRGDIVSSDVSAPATGAWRERLLIELAELDEQIRYWAEHLERAIADGTYRPVIATDIKPGDAIRVSVGWERVAKVNKTTITVVTPPGWSNKVKIVDILEHRPATVESREG